MVPPTHRPGDACYWFSNALRARPHGRHVYVFGNLGEGAQFPDEHRGRLVVQKPYTIINIAKALAQLHGGTLEVHGHADRRGSDDYNMQLAMRRANAVADAIAAQLSPEARARLRVEAIDPSRVATTGQR